MKVALIQSSLFWENPTANRNYFEEQINAIPEKVDLIVLPEMFSTGFTMNPELVFETMQGETIQWFRSLAKAQNSAITGSLVIKEKGNFYNRLVFVFPSGAIQCYDKRHLFKLAGEDKVYTSGKEKLIVAYQGWKICLLICYDLRFPVFARNTEGYDLLIYVANWPKPRINAWDILLKARSVENMCYRTHLNF
jgi:omega-amidase